VRRHIGSLFDQSEYKDTREDLLALLLQDPLFSENNEVIIDELLTIFFAGSQTTANVTQNLILQLCKHPKYKEQILEEIKREIGWNTN
jgi:cytochrome P450